MKAPKKGYDLDIVKCSWFRLFNTLNADRVYVDCVSGMAIYRFDNRIGNKWNLVDDFFNPRTIWYPTPTAAIKAYIQDGEHAILHKMTNSFPINLDMDDVTNKDEDLIREEITNCASITQVVFNEEDDVLLVQDTYGEQYDGHQTVVWKDDDSGEIILGGKAQDLEAKFQAQTEGEIISDEIEALFQECVKYIPKFENSYLDDRDGTKIEIADQDTLEVQETFYTSNEVLAFLSEKLSESMQEILGLLTSLFNERN